MQSLPEAIRVQKPNAFQKSNDLTKKTVIAKKDIFSDLQKPQKRPNPFNKPELGNKLKKV